MWASGHLCPRLTNFRSGIMGKVQKPRGQLKAEARFGLVEVQPEHLRRVRKAVPKRVQVDFELFGRLLVVESRFRKREKRALEGRAALFLPKLPEEIVDEGRSRAGI